jgi:threonine aldolase
MPPTSLICLENAHSFGRSVPLAAMDEVREVAKDWKLPIHLDGARIFNAATSIGCDVKEIAARSDSVMCCLSKGLCAPVGSILAGPKKFIEKARLKRKIMGGGMRQAGVLAAAGIIALEGQTSLIKEDHIRAKRLALGLAKIPSIKIRPKETEINMVFFTWPPAEEKKTSMRIVEIFKKHKIIINPPEKGLFRFVTHYWISDNDVETVLAACREAFGDRPPKQTSDLSNNGDRPQKHVRDRPSVYL